MSEKMFEINPAEFSEDLTLLASHSAASVQAMYRLLCKSCKALICRREAYYLEVVLDKIDKHNPAQAKYAAQWVKTVISGIYRYQPAIDRISVIADDEDPEAIAGITKIRNRNLIEVAPYKTEPWTQAEQVLAWIESHTIYPTDLGAHLPKRTPKKVTVYEQAVNFAKVLGKKLDKPTEIGKLTADQRQKLHNLLESIKQIMPGILD